MVSGTGKVIGDSQLWSTEVCSARVNLTTGSISFEVRGLVLAGGNDIGTPGPITQVMGTIVCDTEGKTNGNSALASTPLVSLSGEGNASLKGTIPTASLSLCTETNIAFLIQTSSGNDWIASGVVRSSR